MRPRRPRDRTEVEPSGTSDQPRWRFGNGKCPKLERAHEPTLSHLNRQSSPKGTKDRRGRSDSLRIEGAEIPSPAKDPHQEAAVLRNASRRALAVKTLLRPDPPRGLAPVKIGHASRIKIAALERVQQGPVSRPNHPPGGEMLSASDLRQRLPVHVGVDVSEVGDVVSEEPFELPPRDETGRYRIPDACSAKSTDSIATQASL